MADILKNSDRVTFGYSFLIFDKNDSRIFLIVGGADAHRMDLSSMIMLKDNHIASRGVLNFAHI